MRALKPSDRTIRRFRDEELFGRFLLNSRQASRRDRGLHISHVSKYPQDQLASFYLKRLLNGAGTGLPWNSAESHKRG
jgi:hypothetical protein